MRRAILITISALVAAACGPAPSMSSQDSGPITLGDGSSPAACAAPTTNFGTSIGTNMTPISLPTCTGAPFDFYGANSGFCDAKYTVFGIAAGWCGPCRMEASMMQQQLIDQYGPRGVRVIVAIIQNNTYGPPDNAFCQGWVDQYGLVNDGHTNAVLTDPNGDTGIYFTMNALPANLIVDSHGQILHHEVGVTSGLQSITAKLDQLLAQNP